MSDFSSLIQAIAALLWPLFFFVALILFRNEIKSAAGRLRKGKFFELEAEFSEPLEKLDKFATKTLQIASELPKITDRNVEDDRRNVEVNEKILSEATVSPKIALINLAGEIERTIRVMLSNGSPSPLTDPVGVNRYASPIQALAELINRYNLPSTITESVKSFWAVRNALVHGVDASESELISAIDSGIKILHALQEIAVSIPYFLVREVDVKLYKNEECTIEHEDVSGVVVENTHFERNIFPVTKRYVVGTRVSQRWNPKSTFYDAWYYDSVAGHRKVAWQSAMEFCGEVF